MLKVTKKDGSTMELSLFAEVKEGSLAVDGTPVYTVEIHDITCSNLDEAERVKEKMNQCLSEIAKDLL